LKIEGFNEIYDKNLFENDIADYQEMFEKKTNDR